MTSDGSRRSDRTRSQPRLLGSVSIGARNAVADAWRVGGALGPKHDVVFRSGSDPTVLQVRLVAASQCKAAGLHDPGSLRP